MSTGFQYSPYRSTYTDLEHSYRQGSPLGEFPRSPSCVVNHDMFLRPDIIPLEHRYLDRPYKHTELSPRVQYRSFSQTATNTPPPASNRSHERTTVEKRYSSIKQDNRRLRQELSQMEDQLKELREGRYNLQVQGKGMMDRYNQLEDKVIQLEGDIRHKDSKIDYLENFVNELKRQKAELLTDSDTLSRELQNIKLGGDEFNLKLQRQLDQAVYDKKDAERRYHELYEKYLAVIKSGENEQLLARELRETKDQLERHLLECRAKHLPLEEELIRYRQMYNSLLDQTQNNKESDQLRDRLMQVEHKLRNLQVDHQTQLIENQDLRSQLSRNATTVDRRLESEKRELINMFEGQLRDKQLRIAQLEEDLIRQRDMYEGKRDPRRRLEYEEGEGEEMGMSEFSNQKRGRGNTDSANAEEYMRWQQEDLKAGRGGIPAQAKGKGVRSGRGAPHTSGASELSGDYAEFDDSAGARARGNLDKQRGAGGKQEQDPARKTVKSGGASQYSANPEFRDSFGSGYDQSAGARQAGKGAAGVGSQQTAHFKTDLTQGRDNKPGVPSKEGQPTYTKYRNYYEVDDELDSLEKAPNAKSKATTVRDAKRSGQPNTEDPRYKYKADFEVIPPRPASNKKKPATNVKPSPRKRATDRSGSPNIKRSRSQKGKARVQLRNGSVDGRHNHVWNVEVPKSYCEICYVRHGHEWALNSLL